MEPFLSTTIISVGIIASITTLLMSCASCKRIFKTKKKLDIEGKKEKIEIIAIENASASKENGINNPAYDQSTNNDENLQKSGDVDLHSKDDPIDQTIQAEMQHEVKENNPALLRIENEREQTVECANGSKTLTVDGVTPANSTESQSFSKLSDSQIPQIKSAENQIKMKQLDNIQIDSIRSDDISQLSEFVKNISQDIPEEKEQIATIHDTAPVGVADIVIKNDWRRDVKLKDLLDMGLINDATAENVITSSLASSESIEEREIPESLKPFLCGESPVAGILLSETGEKKSIFRSAKDGILRRGTAISLLEAQAATGNIIDPVTGRKMSVAEAFQLGLLDKVYETVVSRAERAVVGYKTRVSDETLSLGQAMERGLVMESHGIRLLEAQLDTGGIIDHRVNVKVPVDIAIKRGLLDSRLADKLKAACEDISDITKNDDLKTFFDPNTEENVTYRELMRRSVVDDDTGMRLYPLEKVGKKRYSYTGYSGRSSLASSRASSKESIPAALAAGL